MGALSNGFSIITAIAGGGDGLTFSEVVDRTGLPKASTHRLLRELVEIGAASFDESARRYRGGLLLAELGASVMDNYDIRRVVRPHLEALHEATGSVATLGIRDGEQGIYADKIEPADFVIRLHSEVGKSFPLHCTAIGKVLLAHSDAATIRKVTQRKLKSYTANTITDGKLLREELDSVVRQGYAIDCEEITRGLICVAAPIYGLDGEVAAAVSSTVLSFDADDALINRVTAQVMECASAASV